MTKLHSKNQGLDKGFLGEHTFTKPQKKLSKVKGVGFAKEGDKGTVVGIHHWRIPDNAKRTNLVIQWPDGTTTIAKNRFVKCVEKK